MTVSMQMTKDRVMRDDEPRGTLQTISARQNRALIILSVIQFLCSVINIALLITMAVAHINLLVLSIATIIIYAVMYFNFCKFLGALNEQGTRPRWTTFVKIISPIIYIPSMIVAAILMS